MKKVLLAILFLLFGLSSNAQWTPVFTNTPALEAVCFTSVNTGYTIGQSAYLYKTTNAGTSWNYLSSAYGFYAETMCFTDANTGYIAGGYQTIKKTINAGASWVIQDTGTSAFYASIHFPATDTGYVVGTSGLLKKTVNGGINWIAQASGTGQTLNSVFFVNTSIGYIAGNGGVIKKTTNGGVSWIAQISGTTQALSSIFFTDTITGYVVGGGGVIKKTIDGGTTWIIQTSSSSVQLNDVHFVDADTGYIAGNSGTVLKTIDGGTNWMVQLTGVSTNLNSISFPNSLTGYVAGGYWSGPPGKVLKTTNGGGTTYPCAPVLIASQPSNSIVCSGHTTSFSVQVSGYIPFTFKWYKNGILIDSTVSNSSTNTYTTPVLSAADSGNVYYCVINNTCPNGTSYQVTTNSVTLTVNPVCIPVTFVSANPTTTINGTVGYNYSCSIVVSGTPPFIYKWYVNNNLSHIDTLYSMSDNFTFWAYYVGTWTIECDVTNCNSCGTAGGGLGTLTHYWNFSIDCPYTYFATQPANQTKTTCQTATFSALPSGTVDSYQWYKNGIVIPGANSATYTTPLLTLAYNGNTYYCIAYYCGQWTFQPYSIQSNTATLTISTPASILVQPQNQTVISGNSTIFNVSVSGTPNFSYYWYKNGALVSSTLNTSVTSSAYTTPILTMADSGSTYFCKVINGTAGCYVIYSDTVLLTVICAPVTINSPTICSGETVTLTAAGASSYVWSAGAIPTGVNTATVAPTSTTTYTVAGTNTCGTDTASATVLVNAIDNSVNISWTTLTSNQSGATYQWLNCETGSSPITGATNQSYIINTNGQYAVAINLGGCVDTSACVLFYSVGINNTNENTITISPNPLTSQTTIAFNESQKNTSIKITDVIGKEIKTINFTGKQCVIEKGEMNSGVYFVEVSASDGFIARKKMVVQ